MPMSLGLHAVFLACVTLATFAQCVTGFAFGLILLGLVALFHVAPLNEVSVAVSALTLFNALITLSGRRAPLDRKILQPVLVTSLLGVGIGLWILGWLSGAQMDWLRLLLGIVIVGCSLMQVVQSKVRAKRSSSASFWLAGGLTGVLSGLFSSGGPPIVFHLYRQPLTSDSVRHMLIAIFAANAALRLAIVVALGDMTRNILWLTLEALPVVLLLSAWIRRRPPQWSVRTLRHLVFVLLLTAGTSLVGDALPRLWRGM